MEPLALTEKIELLRRQIRGQTEQGTRKPSGQQIMTVGQEAIDADHR